MMSFLATHAVSLLGLALALGVIGHVLRDRRSPQATVAWLVTILAFPYLGVPLYLVFGTRKLASAQQSKPPIDLARFNPDEEPTPIAGLLRAQGMAGASSGNAIRLHSDGQAAYRALVDLIDSASETLWLEIFILHPDEVGHLILERLVERARSGVEVKVLLDGLGSFSTRERFFAPLREAGGQAAFFNPILHRPFRGNSNLRNHRKLGIADGRRVLAGGTNIATEYLGPDPDPVRWKDLCFSLEGPAVESYREVFACDWRFATGESIELEARAERAGDAFAQVVPSGPDVARDPLYTALLSAVFGARERIWAVTPYYVPNDALAQALVLAARRGVDTRILVPARSNHRLADLARGAPLRDLQEAGGVVQLFEGGMVHAKAMVVDDDFGMLGSANLDMRSLFFNYEIALLVYRPEEVREIESWIASLSRGCREGLPPAGLIRELAEGALRIIAPLL